MAFQLTDNFIQDLRSALSANDEVLMRSLMADLHPADAAELLADFEVEEAMRLYKFLEEEVAAETLVLLDDDRRDAVLDGLSPKEIAEQLIDNLDSDDAADVLAELTDDQQDEVLSHVEDIEQASDIVDLLNYDPDTAGGIMAKELIRVHVDRNVLECVREIRRQAEDVENIYTIYVVDNEERLVGVLSLKNLLTKPLRTKVRDVFNPNIVSVKANTPAEEVAMLMDKYDLVVIPVVDGLNRLVGRVTFDDMVDVLREENTEDVQKMGGVEALEEPYMATPFWQMIRKRVGWLVLLFLGELLTATAMSFFEDQLAKAVILAIFVPLIISSGGNSGSQASTLIIRALALGEITVRDWWSILKKELKSGLVLGGILGVLGFLRVMIWSNFIEDYGPYWLPIGLTVGITLTGVVLWGCLVGSLFPLILKRFKLDPAVSSAPFVATLVDVTGLIIYFSISMLFLTEMFNA
ncbi:MAG: magnesium transporter [Bacteroidetes bacterium]|jgi:magnesium transporter|nr:magnesium transporter [Bacteroidota bacterium]